MIYFAQDLSGGPIKIGFSDNVLDRIRQLEIHYGRELAILATMEGGRDEEQALHARFAHLRFGRTEQFKPDPDLLAFIGRPLLVGVNPAAVEAMDPGYHIKFDKVLANKARQVAISRGVSLVEYLTELNRPLIDRDYAKVLRELEGEA